MIGHWIGPGEFVEGEPTPVEVVTTRITDDGVEQQVVCRATVTIRRTPTEEGTEDG